MSTNEKSDGVMDLPHMAEVFEALRRGKHISLKDGDIYHALKKHEGVYEQLFSKLGFKLVHHARDFFYFLDLCMDMAANAGKTEASPSETVDTGEATP